MAGWLPIFPISNRMAAHESRHRGKEWQNGCLCFLSPAEWLPIDSGVENVRILSPTEWLPIFFYSGVKNGRILSPTEWLPNFPDSEVKNGRMAAYNSYLQQNGCLFFLTLG
jgi:hypothetical protein